MISFVDVIAHLRSTILSDYFTKQEIENIFGGLDLNDLYYTKSEINTRFIDYYTKTEVTNLLSSIGYKPPELPPESSPTPGWALTDIYRWNYATSEWEVVTDLNSGSTYWLPPVETFSDIATTYPTPREGFVVSVNDTNQIYRYDYVDDEWKVISVSIPLASETTDGRMSSADYLKLMSIQSEATKNFSDAYLLNRSNHTGTQPISSIANLENSLLNIDESLDGLYDMIGTKEDNLGLPPDEGYVLSSSLSGTRTWIEQKDFKEISVQDDGTQLPVYGKLNFIGADITDEPELDRVTIDLTTVDTGYVDWNLSGDFNAEATFSEGMQYPSTNDELKLTYSAGLLKDDYSTTSLIDMPESNGVEVLDGKLQLARSINFGNGADGNVVFPTSGNFSTDIFTAGRSYPDAVSYNVVGLSKDFALLNEVPNGLAVGDEIIIINMMGVNATYGNVGNYEFLRIKEVDTVLNKITFETSKTKNYGSSTVDTDIGVTANTNQIVLIQRVPNYNTATLPPGSTLTCSKFNTNKYGLIVFRAQTFNHYGTINITGCGYQSGTNSHGYGPGGLGGLGGGVKLWSTATNAIHYAGAGGHIVAGAAGETAAGAAYDSNTISKLYLGGAGGGGGVRGYINYKPKDSYFAGGHGGGAIAVYARDMILSGLTISSGTAGEAVIAGSGGSPSDTYGRGGGGAGGSIVLQAINMTMGTNTLTSTGHANYKQGGYGKNIIRYQVLEGVSSSSPTLTSIPTTQYSNTALVRSRNILQNSNVTAISEIELLVSSKPSTVTATIQISQDATSWYAIDGTLDGETPVIAGVNIFDISALTWTGSNLYYKVNIENTGDDTMLFDAISVDYFPKEYYTSDQTWTSKPFHSFNDRLISPTELTINWEESAGNMKPKFRLLASNNSSMSGAVAYPNSEDYFEEGGSFNINNGVTLQFGIQVSEYYRYWQVQTVLNAGNETQATPKIKSINIKYHIDKAKISYEYISIDASDNTTNLSVQNNLTAFRLPYEFHLTEIRASLLSASTSGDVSIDVRSNGLSILNPKITIQQGQKTNKTASIQPQIIIPDLIDDEEITIDILSSGVDAKGLRLWFIGIKG